MEKAILCTHIGEFGWCVLRMAPHVLWTKVKKYKNKVKLIIQTRPDRFDLYGKYADIFVPLEIKGDYGEYQSDCFKLTRFPLESYHKLTKDLYQKFSKKYEIVEQIFPAIEKRRYTEKNQYSQHEMLFDFKPRPENKIVVDEAILNDKPLITLGPRYRRHHKQRNWPHWEKFYNIIHNDDFLKQYNFVICGKSPEYIPDKKNRFFDVNHLPIKENTSLVGYTIEIMKRSVLVIGSQSGIPNLANLIGTPTLQWGNEERAHVKKYNVKNTPTTFIKDLKFECDPNVIVENMKTILTKRRK